MKIHTPVFLPPPSPAPPPPTTARNDLQLASTKASMAFDQSLETKPGSDQPAQAGYKSHGGHGGGAARRPPTPAPASPPPAATESAEAPAEASTARPYAPGTIIDIEA